MNTDINKQIEEEAREYLMRKCGVDISQFGNSDELYLTKGELIKSITHCVDSVIDSSRWRKVSEGLPEYSVDVLCKYDSGTLFIGYLSKVDNAFRVANTHYNVIREVIEWKPID